MITKLIAAVVDGGSGGRGSKYRYVLFQLRNFQEMILTTRITRTDAGIEGDRESGSFYWN